MNAEIIECLKTEFCSQVAAAKSYAKEEGMPFFERQAAVAACAALLKSKNMSFQKGQLIGKFGGPVPESKLDEKIRTAKAVLIDNIIVASNGDEAETLADSRVWVDSGVSRSDVKYPQWRAISSMAYKAARAEQRASYFARNEAEDAAKSGRKLSF